MLSPASAQPIAEAFGLGPEPVLTGPVARGEVGQIWKLTTATGCWAIKESFAPPSVETAEHDALLQERVGDAGVEVPVVQRTRDGAVLADIDGQLLRAYSWVDNIGTSNEADPAEIGRLVAAIHRVVVDGANPVDPWYTEPVGADGWDQLIAELRRAGAPFAEELAEQRDELLALEAVLRPPVNLQACHRDLFSENILRTTDGGLCVIDWENSGLAEPSQELAVIVFEFSRGRAASARPLYEAYVSSGGPGRLREPADFTMLIAQLGHIAEISCRRWLDPARRDQRDRNVTRIEEFLNDRLTMDTIETILATIR